MKKLAAVHPDNIKTASDIRAILQQTDEWSRLWGDGILKVIHKYDQEVNGSKRTKKQSAGKENKRLMK